MKQQPSTLIQWISRGSRASPPESISTASRASSNDAALVPRAVSSAWRGPAFMLVLTISATTGPGVATSISTLRV